MSLSYCPICCEELEVREVTPCFVCGAWDSKLNTEIHNFEIRETGEQLCLCNICWLEKILSNQGDLKERLQITSNEDLRSARSIEHQTKDKYCPSCRTRLALLKLMVARLGPDGLAQWLPQETSKANQALHPNSASALTRAASSGED